MLQFKGLTSIIIIPSLLYSNNSVILSQVPDQEGLQNLSGELERNGVQHKLWVEQPEDIPTCLATMPFPKTHIQQYFKKFKLFK